MGRHFALILPPVALTGIALAAAGCGGTSQAATGGSSASGYGGAAAVAAAAKTAAITTRATHLGKVLVDGQGRTLYLFEKDKGKASSCNGACASVWPALTTTGKGVARGGLSSAKLGSIRGSNGRKQLTYAGHPLYTYVGDAKAGDTKGQGLDQFGAEWYVLAPSGRKIDNG